jgi:hypothetical protein
LISLWQTFLTRFVFSCTHTTANCSCVVLRFRLLLFSSCWHIDHSSGTYTFCISRQHIHSTSVSVLVAVPNFLSLTRYCDSYVVYQMCCTVGATRVCNAADCSTGRQSVLPSLREHTVIVQSDTSDKGTFVLLLQGIRVLSVVCSGWQKQFQTAS